ncbi:MAG: 3-isopropylmalate dehydrogenase [Alphaproteobacteria bacterium RIFCSPLOWO2_01_FULL_40_26]|nr:MAG: 3-isopropylmalate dehydrogenase [Alphaproteobacteria bacterium RIFCSPHIGHO2_02_FULL_40_34]OFW94477.1 MAG: 3-isopropylmalate dehydrogenase [Alphaproteobacteria bacterium RIFCSPLOWO2_01_FULL_40_26]OFX10188.1 MAG: 3-isopropylmalate dehydrogenase [Alphaproteobacteria bacterium RIFCSPLOWO2_02_FULL_40_19]
MTKKILLIEGDGIGPEVVLQAKKIIEFFSKNTDKKFETENALLGGCAYDALGTPFPDETLNLAKKSDAILLGAVGGPKWEVLEYKHRPERGLLGIRKELELFANLRPAKVFDALTDSSTLKREIILNLDIMIVRELTGDLYFGEPRGVKTLPDGSKQGINTMSYNSKEVERIAKIAFDLAKIRGKKLCSIDKANVIETTEMWREIVTEIGKKNYPEIALSHMYVDNAAMQLVRNPRQFDVVLTGNMFGDILSDLASMLTGSLGMLPSASLGEKFALYEPIHGSAPDIAGKNIANPIATILSLAMMFRYSFSFAKEASLIEKAVENVLNKGVRTADIAKANDLTTSCSQMGDEIVGELKKLMA